MEVPCSRLSAPRSRPEDDGTDLWSTLNRAGKSDSRPRNGLLWTTAFGTGVVRNRFEGQPKQGTFEAGGTTHQRSTARILRLYGTELKGTRFFLWLRGFSRISPYKINSHPFPFPFPGQRQLKFSSQGIIVAECLFHLKDCAMPPCRL